MNSLDHPLVRAYLDRLDVVSSSLPPDRAGELRADIEEHLQDATRPSDGDAEVAAVLERLGPPEDLVAAASDDESTGGGTEGGRAGTAEAPGRDSHRVETAALVLLVIATLAPLTLVLATLAPLPWLAGLVLLFVSRRWSVTDKVLGALAYGVLGLPFVFLAMYGVGPQSFSQECSGGTRADGTTWETCSGGPPEWWPVLVVAAGLALVGLWVYTGVRLARHARRPAR